MKKIIARIKNGKIVLETEGFSGGSCKDITRQLKENLGIVVSETEKPEFYNQDENFLTQEI